MSDHVGNEDEPPRKRRRLSGPGRLRLSPPELQVLKHLASGATYRTIATQLYLSPATISFHASRLQHRLHVPNNTALVALAVVAGILTNDVWPPQLTGLTDIDPALLGDRRRSGHPLTIICEPRFGLAFAVRPKPGQNRRPAES